MYLSSLCRIEEKGKPPFFPLNKVIFANREFTASLQALSELPASIWTGGRSALYSVRKYTLPPCLPFHCLCHPLLLMRLFSKALCHTHTHTAQTPVMQHDLSSYQLLTLSTISGALLAPHQCTLTHRQRSLGVHLQSVGEINRF